MGKWTEVAKTLPRREIDGSGVFREKVHQLKDASRAKALDALADEYRKARAEKDELEAKETAVNARIMALEELLAETFRTENREKPFYFPDGRRVEVSDQISVKCEDNDKVVAWAKANGYERMLSLNPKRLESLTKAALEGNQALPDGVAISAYSQVKLAGG